MDAAVGNEDRRCGHRGQLPHELHNLRAKILLSQQPSASMWAPQSAMKVADVGAAVSEDDSDELDSPAFDAMRTSGT